MGSKNRIAKEIIEVILKDNLQAEYFYDVCCGGANLIDKVPNNYKRIAIDKNKYLIALLNKIKNNPKDLPLINKEEYYKIKNNKENYEDWLVGWCGIGHSYNGVWFGSYAGITKTKSGKIRDYRAEAVRNAIKQSKLIQDVDFICSSYENFKYNKNSVIFIDPPYNKTSKYKAVNDFNHNKFWNWVRDMSNSGYNVYVTEYSAPKDFECIWSKELDNSFNKRLITKSGLEKLFILKKYLDKY